MVSDVAQISRTWKGLEISMELSSSEVDLSFDEWPNWMDSLRPTDWRKEKPVGTNCESESEWFQERG